jgi:ABC-2 type transport system permease protein
LPVSDTATVAAKLVTGLLLAPLVALVVATVSVPLLTYFLKVHFAGNPYSAWPLTWNPHYLVDATVLWTYLTAVGVLWFLPLAAWFLAVSAWAPRNPFLWGLVPPAALFVLGKVFRGTSWAADLVSDRIGGFLSLALNTGAAGPGPGVTVNDQHLAVPASLISWIDPSRLLASPRLWGGLVVGALLVVAAVQGRRYRTEA